MKSAKFPGTDRFLPALPDLGNGSYKLKRGSYKRKKLMLDA
jgi:hypothetical protein